MATKEISVDQLYNAALKLYTERPGDCESLADAVTDAMLLRKLVERRLSPPAPSAEATSDLTAFDPSVGRSEAPDASQ